MPEYAREAQIISHGKKEPQPTAIGKPYVRIEKLYHNNQIFNVYIYFEHTDTHQSHFPTQICCTKEKELDL